MEDLVIKIKNDLEEAEKAYQYNLNFPNKNKCVRESILELYGIKMGLRTVLEHLNALEGDETLEFTGFQDMRILNSQNFYPTIQKEITNENLPLV